MESPAQESTSRLELLQPETQSLIMCHISTVTSLYSLLRASPRFYQVFRSRRKYHLTQLARQVCQPPASAWHAFMASKLPQPRSIHDIENFIRTFQGNRGFEVPIMPLDVSVPMIRLGASVGWLVTDFARDNLNNLTKLGSFMKIEQDTSLVHSELSDFETRRIARAFYRNETFWHLFPTDLSRSDEKLDLSKEFLMSYEFDEIEEICCVRNYIVRCLFSIFDQIEDDLVDGKHSEAIQSRAQADVDNLDNGNWFGPFAKEYHDHFVQHMMTLGSPFIKELFTADAKHRAELVLSNSTVSSDSMTYALNCLLVPYDSAPDLAFNPSSFCDDPEAPSIGWHWKLLGNPYSTFTGLFETGVQDWRYVFWRKDRMIGAGVLDQ